MKLTGRINEVKYIAKCSSELQSVEYSQKFDLNIAPPVFILKKNGVSCSVSKWVSPKRSRSYPFERVYNSLCCPLRITIIPVIKDEGACGDRDFIQWDTVAMMSLLNVHVILVYYDEAELHKTLENKITNQKISKLCVASKLEEILSGSYHSSALHWNIKEMRETLPGLLEGAKCSYEKIGEKWGVKMHDESGIHKLRDELSKGIKNFMEHSRDKSQRAQSREVQTVQPKEILSSSTKASLTIENYLGGQYNLTVDETTLTRGKISLIECKHSKNSLIPSVSDIKDGLLKMILYCNLKSVECAGKTCAAAPILRLTSTKLGDEITSKGSEQKLGKFFSKNNITEAQAEFVRKLFSEARKNGFVVSLGHAE